MTITQEQVVADSPRDALEKLNAICRQRGISQSKLALSAGLSQSTLSLWQRRNSPPPLESITRIAEALGVTVSIALNTPKPEPVRHTFYVHTANTGWLDHPDTFAHVAHALGVQVLIQSDIALHDDEYRLYGEEGPITRTTPITEEAGKHIRQAIAKHLQSPAPAKVEEKPPVVETPPTPPVVEGGQMRWAI